MATRKYKAPALERGLSILEYLALQETPQGLSAISDALNRSRNEIVRLIYVLEESGYIERVRNNDGYVITNRIFNIANARPATRTLIEIAMPEMRRFATITRQSSHLVVRSDLQIVVIGRIEAPNEMSLAVRVGHRRPLIHSTSGSVLVAYQSKETAQNILDALKTTENQTTIDKFLKRVKAVQKNGYEQRTNNLLSSVTDLSVPVFRSGQAVAALTVPFAQMEGVLKDIDKTTKHLKQTALNISRAL